MQSINHEYSGPYGEWKGDTSGFRVKWATEDYVHTERNTKGGLATAWSSEVDCAQALSAFAEAVPGIETGLVYFMLTAEEDADAEERGEQSVRVVYDMAPDELAAIDWLTKDSTLFAILITR